MSGYFREVLLKKFPGAKAEVYIRSNEHAAEKAGIKSGDVIVEFNGKQVDNAQGFRFMVADAGPGAKITMKILREGQPKTLTFKLGDRSKFLAVASSGSPDNTSSKWLGISVSTFTREQADQLGVDFVPGVIIDEIEPGSPADDAGLFKDDIILEVDFKKVETRSDFMKIADQLKDRKKAILFQIKRGNTTMHKAVKP